jgi:uncharacterized protein
MNILSDLNILLGNRCNLGCHYCGFTESDPKKSEYLSLLSVRKIIGYFFEHVRRYPNVQRVLCFNADGEAFMNPGLLLASLEYADALRKADDQIILALVSNATLITQEYARKLSSLGVHVTVSIDGPEQVHNRHRVTADGRPSFTQVSRGIENLRKAGIPLSFRAVVTPETSDNMSQTYDFLRTLDPVRPVKLRPVRGSDNPRYNPAWVRRFSSDFTQMVDDVFRSIADISDLPDDAQYFARYLSEGRQRGAYCSSGEGMLWIMPDGSITPCGILTDGFICGHIDDIHSSEELVGLLSSQASKYIRDHSPAMREPCSDCQWLPACGGGCPAVALSGKPPLCDFYLTLGESIRQQMGEKRG